MPAPSFDIQYVANLARLELTAEERSRLSAQLGDILGYVEQLKEVNVEGVEATAHPFPIVNVTRPDERRETLPHEVALGNAPRSLNGLFQVPKIVE